MNDRKIIKYLHESILKARQLLPTMKLDKNSDYAFGFKDKIVSRKNRIRITLGARQELEFEFLDYSKLEFINGQPFPFISIGYWGNPGTVEAVMDQLKDLENFKRYET